MGQRLFVLGLSTNGHLYITFKCMVSFSTCRNEVVLQIFNCIEHKFCTKYVCIVYIVYDTSVTVRILNSINAAQQV
jgi:hypothetical protein